MTAHILFSDETPTRNEVGGKAAALARLSALGFDIPDFFTVSAATPANQLSDALDQAIDRLGDGPFAVRSSGREEDGASQSHAGQFLSLLNVARRDVADAIRQVWQSGATESLKAYRATHGLDSDGGTPAVIVQRMVDARTAGVAFSADPVSGRRDRIVISATGGLGDRLVSGEVDGEQVTVDKSTGEIVGSPDTLSVLSPADIAAIAKLAARVEETIGTPQDIEWAYEGERLYLLQARAITTPLRAPVIADQNITIFDNSNIVESYPGHVSPLTFSFAQYAYARVYRAFLSMCGVSAETIRSNTSALENMLGRINGRVYYNLINWYRLLALLPGFRLNRSHMETMMGVGDPLPDDVADRLSPPPAKGLGVVYEWGRLVRTGGSLIIEAVRLPRTISRFNVRLNAALATDKQAVQSMSLSELAAFYRRIEATLLDRWDAPLINDFLCMIAFGGSRKLTERWLGAQGLELHNDVMIGQGDIISAEPPQRIARMGRLVSGNEALKDVLRSGDRETLQSHPEIATEIDSYIAKFGDRCTEELKLESITLDVNPQPLFDSIIAAAQQTQGAPPHRSDGFETLNTLLAGKPVKRFVLKRLLNWAKARVRDRENLRFERTRIFGQARRVFLAIGQQLHALDRLDDPRDIFFLTVHEIIGAIEGFGTDTDLASLAAMRKRQFEVDRNKPDPGERITIHGSVIAQDDFSTEATQDANFAGILNGTGCSAGIVRAKARVVHDPTTEKLERGEVLVAQYTDPGWIALFTNASAIVVERGSLLSHSAIVARELGLPCVVGLKGATRALSTGDVIEVDGARGTVRTCA